MFGPLLTLETLIEREEFIGCETLDGRNKDSGHNEGMRIDREPACCAAQAVDRRNLS